VHEGGYTIQWVNNHPQRIDEQFAQQQNRKDITMFDVEKQLRNNRGSFETIRNLSPTRYRFRVLDPDGNDIRAKQSTHVDYPTALTQPIHHSISHN